MGSIYKMIKMIPLAFLFLSLTIHAQNTIKKEISGIITYDGAPLSNVNILIKNSEKGTSTNNKGVYKIRAKEGDILQFTHINMKAIEVLIEDITTTLNISMKAAKNELDEVIISSKKKNKQIGLYPKKPKKISSGGFTIDTRRTGYSVRYISGEELNLSGISIGRALQGKIASYKLVVDDFGVKYVGEEHANHLIQALSENYVLDTDWDGKKYVGITLDWDYVGRKVHLSMPGYCDDALVRFGHVMRKRTDQPHKHEVPVYGAKVQYAKDEDTSPPLSKEEKQFIQQVTGVFLFYARAVDSTMLMSLSAIASRQANPTHDTMKKTLQFLDYVATHPDAKIQFRASDMCLNIHSDASYLSEPRARSRIAGVHFLGSIPEDHKPIIINGFVHVVSNILKCVVASAAEAELGGLFHNCKEATVLRLTLEELGHPQPPTPVHCDNTTATGIANDTVKKHRSRSIWKRTISGSQIKSDGNISMYDTIPARRTLPTIPPRITMHPIIETSDRGCYTLNLYHQ